MLELKTKTCVIAYISLLIVFSAAYPENGPLDRLDPRLYPVPDSLTGPGAGKINVPCYALDYDEDKTVLYYGAGNRVIAYDVLNPKKSVTLSRSIVLDDKVYDIEHRSNVLFVAGGKSGLEIWDVRDPAQPMKLSSFQTRSTALAVSISDSTAYIADADSGMTIVDISNPQEPRALGNLRFPGLALDVFIAGDYGYVADYDSGIRIVSIQDPAAPFETGRLSVPGHAVGIQVLGNLAYLAELKGLRILNIEDPADPVDIEFYQTPDMARKVFVAYPYAYLACGQTGLRIINVSDPFKPVEAAFFHVPGKALSVKICSHYAYVAADRGFTIPATDSPSGNFQLILPVMLFLFMVVGFKLLI